MKSFLSQLCNVETEVLGNTQRYSVYTRQVLTKLISYVERCSFSSSVNTKFVCKNFRLSIRQMQIRWNDTEVDEDEEGKTEETFRSQVSTVSKQLYCLLGYDCLGCFLAQDEVGISKIEDCLDMLEGYPDGIEDYFINQVVDEARSSTFNREYTIEELGPAISELRKLTRNSVWNVIDSIQPEMLSYILYVLKKPLTSNKLRSVNEQKIEIIRELSKEDVSQSNNISYPIEAFIEIIDAEIKNQNAYDESENNRALLKKQASVFTEKGFAKFVADNRIATSDLKALSAYLKKSVEKAKNQHRK